MNATTRRVSVLRGLAAASVVVALAWWGVERAISPIAEREKMDREASAAVRERIKGARHAVDEVRALERDAQTLRRQIDQLAGEIPRGQATIWLPEMVKTHFEAFGLTGPVVRMSTVREEPDLPGFRRGYWSVGVPIPEAGRAGVGALLAVAEFEQQHPFIKVLDFAIRPDPENPQGRVALLNVAALIRQDIHPPPAVGFRAR